MIYSPRCDPKCEFIVVPALGGKIPALFETQAVSALTIASGTVFAAGAKLKIFSTQPITGLSVGSTVRSQVQAEIKKGCNVGMITAVHSQIVAGLLLPGDYPLMSARVRAKLNGLDCPRFFDTVMDAILSGRQCDRLATGLGASSAPGTQRAYYCEDPCCPNHKPLVIGFNDDYSAELEFTEAYTATEDKLIATNACIIVAGSDENCQITGSAPIGAAVTCVEAAGQPNAAPGAVRIMS